MKVLGIEVIIYSKSHTLNKYHNAFQNLLPLDEMHKLTHFIALICLPLKVHLNSTNLALTTTKVYQMCLLTL
jgi:hypothetical protein